MFPNLSQAVIYWRNRLRFQGEEALRWILAGSVLVISIALTACQSSDANLEAETDGAASAASSAAPVTAPTQAMPQLAATAQPALSPAPVFSQLRFVDGPSEGSMLRATGGLSRVLALLASLAA